MFKRKSGAYICFREMEKRKTAIVEALLAKANVLCDAHLKISSEDIPRCFRAGLPFPDSGKAAVDTNNKINTLVTGSGGDATKTAKGETELVKKKPISSAEVRLIFGK